MITPKLSRSLSEELFIAEDGFCVENSWNDKSIEVSSTSGCRYVLMKGGVVVSYTNHESIACNFIYGGK